MRVYVGNCADTVRTNMPNTLTLMRYKDRQKCIVLTKFGMFFASVPPMSNIKIQRQGPRVAPSVPDKPALPRPDGPRLVT